MWSVSKRQNDTSVFELLKSQSLATTPQKQELLSLLTKMMDNNASKIFFQRTIDAYRVRTLLSAARVSAKTMSGVHDALVKAKAKLASLFQNQAEVCKEALTAEVFQIQSSQMNAYSYALPGKRPEIIVTSRLVDVMGHSKMLQAVFLHELGHLVYTHSKYLIAMNILVANTVDNYVAPQSGTKEVMAVFQAILGDFESTADRVMCCAMHEDWPEVVSMFARMASGTSLANGECFIAQLEELKLDTNMAEQAVAQARESDSHSPPLWRLKTLNEFRRSNEFLLIMQNVKQNVK